MHAVAYPDPPSLYEFACYEVLAVEGTMYQYTFSGDTAFSGGTLFAGGTTFAGSTTFSINTDSYIVNDETHTFTKRLGASHR